MRYRFRGVELRTENAAKPFHQASKWLLEQIAQLPRSTVALDYGCGKFRYTIHLSHRVSRVSAVDSSYQVERIQQIANKRMTLREYVHRYLRNVSVHEVSSHTWRQRTYDFVLCSKVLSVIPHRAERIVVLQDLVNVLKPAGQILISTQFRNSYFEQWKASPNATWIKDGWFVRSSHGASFYAIIPPKKLAALCRSAGLSIAQVGSKGETAFVFAGSGRRRH
jgi:2-polyprenyl-3-methyl-5-hydroxy-6-metoxy-1,4-benzoquinol methylase